jgi:glycosyltransferase involved in cell wall biosynthesis
MMMQKKVLIVASVISFIEWFNKENVDYLRKNKGCEVHIAVNTDYMDDTDENHTLRFLKILKLKGVILHNIKFARSPFSTHNIVTYKKLKNLIESEHFDLIHCHTPTVSILTRLAARKVRRQGSIVMYTCHGFHFHKASSKKNWLIYYPIERYMSRHCDYLITINHEDFNRAKLFNTNSVRYIPGVGVDIRKIASLSINKDEYKCLLGMHPSDVLILSIGELIHRKNHVVIIRALAKINSPNIHYAIAGKGELKDYLKNLVIKLKLEKNVHFLGFRTDIHELCHAADIGAFPSKIEGLGLAGIEIMAAGVPLISSNVHGILDYVKEGVTGYTCAPDDVRGFARAIEKLASDESLRIKLHQPCIDAVKPFAIDNALREMWNIYDEILSI